MDILDQVKNVDYEMVDISQVDISKLSAKTFNELYDRKKVLDVSSCKNEVLSIIEVWSKYIDVKLVKKFVSDAETFRFMVYPLNTMGTHHGKSSNPNCDIDHSFISLQNIPVPGMYSGNIGRHMDNITFMPAASHYGSTSRSWSMRFKGSFGIKSVYELMMENENLFRTIVSSRIGSVVDDVITEAKRLTEQRTEYTNNPTKKVDQHLNKIYFPVDDGYHILVPVIHGGMRFAFNLFQRNKNQIVVNKNKGVMVQKKYKYVIGGDQAHLCGENNASFSGKHFMLSGEPPVYRRDLPKKRLKIVVDNGNIFSAINRCYINCNKSEEYARYNNIDLQSVGSSREAKHEAFIVAKRIVSMMFSPIKDIINSDALTEDMVEKMPMEMKKWCLPDTYTLSITSDEYRALTSLALKEIRSKLKLVLLNQTTPTMFDEHMNNCLAEAVQYYLHRI